MNRDFPKMIYRADGANVVNRVVANATELAAAQAEGWGDRKAAIAEAAKAPPPSKTAAAPAAAGGERELQLIEQLADANAKVRLSAEAITEKGGQITAQGARITELEAFLVAARDDANCPDALKGAIGKALGGETIAEPTAPAATGKGKKGK